MWSFTSLPLALLALSVVTPIPGSVSPRLVPRARDSVAVVYEGRTPCGSIALRFTGFPSRNCEKIKWRLTLLREGSGRPAGYRYQGTRTSHQGEWRSESGVGRTVYTLTPHDGGPPLSLLSIEDQVLLLLDGAGHVLAGDASWSYALNRVNRPGAPPDRGR